MKRSSPYQELRANGDEGLASRGLHHDLHFDASGTRLPPPQQPNYSGSMPGSWPPTANPPPPPPPPTSSLQPGSLPSSGHSSPRPPPPPQQWVSKPAPPIQHMSSQFAGQWNQEEDFLDMPEPIPTPLSRPKRPSGEAFHWVVPDEPSRVPPRQSNGETGGPLDTLPAALTAGLSQQSSSSSRPPPPIPPKTPIPHYGGYNVAPSAPLPPPDNDPYAIGGRYSVTPPRTSPSPSVNYQQIDPLYAVQASPPRRTSGERLHPDPHYNALPPRPSSHSGIPSDQGYFAPAGSPNHHQGYSARPNATTPPQQGRHSPRPQHALPQHSSPSSHPHRPSPPRQHTSPHKPSTPPKPQPQLWRPTPPPPTRKPQGPITSNPPSTSLTKLSHLPYRPIVQPAYHRETLDHPQHFAKSGLFKINVIPSEFTTFVAGGEIYGRIDIACKGDGNAKGKSELLLGELGIELIGYDGLIPRRPRPDRHRVCSFWGLTV